MNIRIKIKSIIKDFKYSLNLKRFEFLKIYFSPFKPPKLEFYFGPIAVGVPYFLPRQFVKVRDKDAIGWRPKPVKWFQVKFIGLGYKTKWSPTDYRHEWDPLLSIVFCKRQFVMTWRLLSDPVAWELWLYYDRNTNKARSKEYRVRYCVLHNPSIWSHHQNGFTTTYNVYSLVLKKKYLHLT